MSDKTKPPTPNADMGADRRSAPAPRWAPAQQRTSHLPPEQLGADWEQTICLPPAHQRLPHRVCYAILELHISAPATLNDDQRAELCEAIDDVKNSVSAHARAKLARWQVSVDVADTY